MDNHYVPNLTIGPMVCKALKDYGIKAPIDVHLMVSPVDDIIESFADAGADYITFHPEATGHIVRRSPPPSWIQFSGRDVALCQPSRVIPPLFHRPRLPP
jgi:hypothetical protein